MRTPRARRQLLAARYWIMSQKDERLLHEATKRYHPSARHGANHLQPVRPMSPGFQVLSFHLHDEQGCAISYQVGLSSPNSLCPHSWPRRVGWARSANSCYGLCHRVGQQPPHQYRVTLDRQQQRPPRRIGFAPVLLPITQGGYGQMERVGELRLRHAETKSSTHPTTLLMAQKGEFADRTQPRQAIHAECHEIVAWPAEPTGADVSARLDRRNQLGKLALKIRGGDPALRSRFVHRQFVDRPS
jgi:hypothetical protein